MLLELQTAQAADFVADLVHMRRQVDARVAAFEFVVDLGARKLMQHDLHHGEFVQVGIEQAGNDHGRGLSPLPRL